MATSDGLSDQVSGDTGRPEAARLAAREVFDQYRPTGQIAGHKGALYQKLYAACEAYAAALAPEPSGVPPETHAPSLFCQLCWDRASIRSIGSGMTQTEYYQVLIAEHDQRATTEIERVTRAGYQEAEAALVGSWPEAAAKLRAQQHDRVRGLVARLGATPKEGCPVSEPTKSKMPENFELSGLSKRSAKLLAWTLVLSMAGAFGAFIFTKVIR